MKILIIYRHYWPDTTPLGSMLRTLAEHLAARGHRVYVYTAQPSYHGRTTPTLPKREFKGGVRIIRAPLLRERRGGPARYINAGLFLLSWLSYAARHRFDLVWTNTLPPVVNGLTGYIAAKAAGARFLYHVQDVYPEVLAISAQRPPGAVWRGILRLLAAADSLTCRLSSAVVVLSDDMMQTIADRGGNGAVAFHVLNNFVQSELGTAAPPPVRPAARPGFRMVFSGNLGRFQALDTLVEAMALIPAEEGISLEFIGTGVAAAGLRRVAAARGITTVTFTDWLPSDEAFRHIRSADLGIISLVPGMYRVSYPSKLMTYLAAGLPVLAVVEPESALARYLEDSGAGIAVSGDAAAVAAAIRKARDRFGGDTSASERMTALAERDFGRAQACERWSQLIDSFVTD